MDNKTLPQDVDIQSLISFALQTQQVEWIFLT